MLSRFKEDETDLSSAIITLGQRLAVDRGDFVRLDVIAGVVDTVDSRLRDLVAGSEEFSGLIRHFWFQTTPAI